ncbi:RlpA-like double-psi beta-barrel-protein domain-containing protein-containing protein [Rhizoctonia solani]|nr:RlpA-like double-psi beta-barrel-protein domain-containing protein-containing protein [Rhizoctonia solani]
MLSSFVTALALAASVSNVAAGPIRHATRGYAQDAEILEDYTPYHVRYLALECHKQHNTQFFEDCCHPLLRWQKLSDRPAKCIPSASASSSAVAAEPTSPPIDEDPIPDYDDDCEEATTAPVQPVSTTQKPQYTAPAPTTQAQTTSYKPEPTPEPTTSAVQSTTTKKTTAEPEPTQGSGGSDAIKGGFATFFEQRGVAGACGAVHAETDKVVALDYRRYGDLGRQSSDCGRTVLITNPKNGKTVTAKVADACPTCENENCLDLSYGAFDEIATRKEGMVAIEWRFI